MAETACIYCGSSALFDNACRDCGRVQKAPGKDTEHPEWYAAQGAGAAEPAEKGRASYRASAEHGQWYAQAPEEDTSRSANLDAKVRDAHTAERFRAFPSRFKAGASVLLGVAAVAAVRGFVGKEAGDLVWALLFGLLAAVAAFAPQKERASPPDLAVRSALALLLLAAGGAARDRLPGAEIALRLLAFWALGVAYLVAEPRARLLGAALGLAGLSVQAVTSALGGTPDELVARQFQAEGERAVDGAYADAALGFRYRAPKGVSVDVPPLAPDRAAALLTKAALAAGPRYLRLASNDGLVEALVVVVRLPGEVEDVVAEAQLAGERSPELAPPAWKALHPLALESTRDARRGVLLVGHTDDGRFVLLDAEGPRAGFAGMVPRLKEMAAGLQLDAR